MSGNRSVILLSLHPRFAKAIAEGSKTVELRRRFPTTAETGWLILYVTSPISAVVGMIRISRVTEAAPSTLWRHYGSAAVITKKDFDLYFEGCDRGFAIELGELRSFEPLSQKEMARLVPGFTPPQSFRYIERTTFLELKRSSRRHR
jgi:predicted transcriptional regulator